VAYTISTDEGRGEERRGGEMREERKGQRKGEEER